MKGRYLIDGVVLHDLPDDYRSDYRAQNMGFVFQLYNLLPVLNTVENVELPSAGLGCERSQGSPQSLLWNCWTWWASLIVPTTCPVNFQEASASGLP